MFVVDVGEHGYGLVVEHVRTIRAAAEADLNHGDITTLARELCDAGGERDFDERGPSEPHAVKHIEVHPAYERIEAEHGLGEVIRRDQTAIDGDALDEGLQVW